MRQGFPGPLMPSPFSFEKHGESGIDVSEIFPHLARKVDDIAFLRSVYGRSNDHVQSTYEMQTGQIRMGFPSVGAWVTYGLGSESSSLPAFVVMNDYRGGPLGGPNDWSAGFMPASYQGTLFRAAGDPIVDLKPPEGMTTEEQRARLDTLAKLNELDMQKYPGSSELSARISSYELAYRMQGCAPDAVDVSSESEATKKLYGLDEEITAPFGRQCLMARRLVEHGVRFVQLFHGGMGESEHRYVGRPQQFEGEPFPARRRVRSTHCGFAHGSRGARAPRLDARRLARRVRPDAHLSARSGQRPQPGNDDGVDGRRRDSGRTGDRRER